MNEPRYEIVERGPTHFEIMSVVADEDWAGRLRQYRNFVAKAETYEQAEKIVAALS